ncbi:MAG: LPS assembly protein LptD [Methylovulum sp.]|uniref:LPS assembly protein LptD n=1 Tax=Methylovulum sp. TaxID=1916980 RepID=UPI00260361B0|nr:LPS assembly protein LptD [Methylovulum sp.]MDD2722720.1 LPS assembly protein LptD [Methylovulum sp.]
MLRRLFLVFLPSLTASNSFADASAWSCQQDKNSNEWVCSGDQNSPDQTDSVAVPVPDTSNAPAPLIEPEKPAPVVVERLVSVLPPPEPAAIASPKPEPAILKPLAATSEKTPEASSKPAITPCASDPNCSAGEEDSENSGINLLAPVFGHQEELIFRSLAGQFAKDPWANCMATVGTQKNYTPVNRLRDRFPLDVKSNYSEIFDNEIGNYSGNVELNRADQHAQSHAANYDSVSETLDLQGDVYYSDDELALHSESATLKLASDQAKLRDTLFIFPATPLRGRAKAVYRDNKDLSHYQDVTYTSCRPGNQDWALHASELKLNKLTGKGSAKNAWVEFKGTPVFYSPYLGFPIDNRRMSGFLPPSFGNTQTGGFLLATPYYWNLAPNYDAILRPKYFSKRGILLGSDFRYLSEQSKGKISLEYMPDDEILKTSRYQGSLKHSTQFTPNISANLDLNYVSDKNYFAELGNALSFPNFSFLRSSADVNYFGEGVAFTTRVENYQTIDRTLSGLQIPYRRLPQINLNLSHSFDRLPLDVQLENESVFFQHNDLVNGQRLNFRPSVSLPLQTDSAYLTPKISLQHTEYFLTNQIAGLPENISRTLPIFSTDTGLFLERDVNIADTNLVHTLEPRLFYLYIPKTDQSKIPLFDSSIYDFWYSSMFRENRFSGSDRVQDANQVTTALTSRLIDPVTGYERLRLSLGEIFYFRNREVTLCGDYPSNLCAISPVEKSPTSPLVAELGSQFNRHVSIDSGIQWDPDTNKIVRGKATLHLVREPGQVINLGYLYRVNPLVPKHTNDITQSDMSFHWPVYNNWSVVGRWQYSWLYNTTQDGFVGLEKENCCWRFRIIGRQFLNSINNINNSDVLSNNTVEGTASTGIFFQIELKGLTGVGEQLDDFFVKSIYGYRKPGK